MSDPNKERTYQIINVAAVVVATVLVGAVVVQVYQSRKAAPAVAESAVPQAASYEGATDPTMPPDPTQPPPEGGFKQEIQIQAPPAAVQLSQRAKMLATEFYCMCDMNGGKGCGLILGECNCTKNPGQREMKAFLQAMVDQEKTSDEIRAAMVAKYGEASRVK